MSSIFYLHGFASSPQSSKARFFAERLARHGLILQTPAFNEPDFSTLTISRMIRQIISHIERSPAGPVVLIGSSLGGFVAVQVAASPANRIVSLVLLAPALELAWEHWSELGPGGLEAWRASDRLEVFHYGFHEPRAIRFSLYEDSRRYDAFSAPVAIPVLIFQGRSDTAVNPASAERFARAKPNRTLHLLNDGHQLLDSLEFIWTKTARALGLE